ncbi:MAG: hypothetical protein HY905_17000 [Deltaproteobacteria bacterium]|nr:hypothetical protein [Deltaproteobacteria bacterium]
MDDVAAPDSPPVSSPSRDYCAFPGLGDWSPVFHEPVTDQESGFPVPIKARWVPPDNAPSGASFGPLYLHYRPVGESRFRAIRMVQSAGWFYAEIPCATPEPSAWEYAIVGADLGPNDDGSDSPSTPWGLDAAGAALSWERPLDRPFRVRMGSERPGRASANEPSAEPAPADAGDGGRTGRTPELRVAGFPERRRPDGGAVTACTEPVGIDALPDDPDAMPLDRFYGALGVRCAPGDARPETEPTDETANGLAGDESSDTHPVRRPCGPFESVAELCACAVERGDAVQCEASATVDLGCAPFQALDLSLPRSAAALRLAVRGVAGWRFGPTLFDVYEDPDIDERRAVQCERRSRGDADVWWIETSHVATYTARDWENDTRVEKVRRVDWLTLCTAEATPRCPVSGIPLRFAEGTSSEPPTEAEVRRVRRAEGTPAARVTLRRDGTVVVGATGSDRYVLPDSGAWEDTFDLRPLPSTSPDAPTAGAVPVRIVPGAIDKLLIRDEVDALVEEAEAGRPATVTLAVEHTFDWGCDCPPFVFVASDGGADYEEEFVFPTFAEGVPDAVYTVRGAFDLTGHYTGRWLDMFGWYEERGRQVQPRSIYGEERLAWEELHPEFLVDEWCYAPPSLPADSGWDVEPMTRMRTDGVPLCPGEDWPAWLDEPTAEGVE